MSDPLFPDLRSYPDAPEAFLGGDLNREWVLGAYPLGFFPWPDEEERLIWCNPLERMVFDPGTWRAPKRLLRTMRQGFRAGRLQVRLDRDFAAVITACQNIGRVDGTWITEDLKQVFLGLHGEGLAHSVEVLQEGRLVGGLYGLSLGGAFFGESMFSVVPNASKIALTVLLTFLEEQGIPLFDAQVENPHLVQLNGRLEPRAKYLDRLEGALAEETRFGPWTLDEDFLARRYAAQAH